MTEYTYPNISFNSKILGPTPVTPPWRDGYAIIGEFNRGPRVPTNSSQLSVLTALYGEDKSSGSIALQQAMAQGASNATVVRVIAGTEPAAMSFEVAGDTTSIIPRVGYESTVANTQVLDSFNRTTGFKLNFDYIGQAILSNVSYGQVRTVSSAIEHPEFSGRAQMDFAVSKVQSGLSTEPVVYEDDNEELSISLFNTAYGDYQVISYLEGDNDYVEQYLEPGFSLRSTQVAQPNGLVIASNPFTLNEATGLKGVLVKGAYSPTTSLAGIINEVTDTRTLQLEGLLIGSTPTELTSAQASILEDAVVLVAGQPFTPASVTEVSNEEEAVVVVDKSLSTTALAGQVVSFAPVVSDVALDGADTLVTLSGLPTNMITAGVKLNFSTDLEKSYEVDTIDTPYDVATGVVVVKIKGDVRLAAKKKSYAIVTSAVGTPTTTNVRVHFPVKTQALIGYSFRPVDSNAALPATNDGRRYFNLSDSSFDSYIVVPEGSGGKAIKFYHHTVPNTLTSASKIYSETLGIKFIFGYDNDFRNYFVEGMSWAVPFLKDSVVVGGPYDSPEAFANGTQANIILKELENAIYSNSSLASLFSDIKTDLSVMPYKFTATPTVSGVEGNRIHWSLERYVAGPTALYESNTNGVITVDKVPDIILNNATQYSLLFNGKEYPILSVNDVSDTITVNVGTDTNASFLNLASTGDVLQLVSQSQTRDFLVRLEPDSFFSTTPYGADKIYTFKGGRNAASFAYRDFYSLEGKPVLRVQALSPGNYGNQIKITVLPDEVTADSAKFYLQIEDTDPTVSIGSTKIETFYLDNNAIDSDSGLYLDTRESNLIRAYFLPAAEFQPSRSNNTLPASEYRALPLRVAPSLEIYDAVYASGFTRVNAQGAATVKDISLFRGADFADSNPPSALRARVNGYINAIKQIETADVTWIGVVGISHGDPDYREVFEYLKQVVDNSNPANGGFRRGVIQLSPNVSPRQAATLKATIASSRIIQIAGVAQGSTTNGIPYNQASVVGAYIGLGASRQPHISPASVYGGRVPALLNYSSVMGNPSVLEAYTRGNTEVFYKDDCIGAYKFLNGLTTSNDPGVRYVSVSHTWDQVRDAVYKALLPYRSQPGTPQLWARIATACDALLSQFMRDEWLMRYAPTICDERNNSEADLIRGVVNVLIQATPTFPADYIRVTDVLDLRASISLNVQPGQSISDF